MRADGDRLHRAHALVGIGRNLVGREERRLLPQLVDLGPGDREDVDARPGRGQLGDRRGGEAAGEEEGVERAVLHLFGRLIRLHELRLDVLLGDAEGAENGLRVEQRAGTGLVERDLLALQIGDRLHVGGLAHDQVHALRIEIGDRAQFLDLRLALEDAGAGIGPVGHVGLDEAGFGGTADDRVDVRDGAVAGDGRGDELRRVRDRVRDQAADRIVGPGGAAGADPEEGRRLGKGEPGGESRSAEHEPCRGEFGTKTQCHVFSLPMNGALARALRTARGRFPVPRGPAGAEASERRPSEG